MNPDRAGFPARRVSRGPCVQPCGEKSSKIAKPAEGAGLHIGEEPENRALW